MVFTSHRKKKRKSELTLEDAILDCCHPGLQTCDIHPEGSNAPLQTSQFLPSGSNRVLRITDLSLVFRQLLLAGGLFFSDKTPKLS